MSQREKLIARIQARPPEAKFADVRALLEEFGWSEDRRKGSHITYVKVSEKQVITIALTSGRFVKRHYLDDICKRLGLDE